MASIAVIKHHGQKSLEEERVGFSLQLSGHSLILRGIGADAGHGGVLLVDLLLVTCPTCFLARLVTTSPEVAVPIVSLAGRRQSLIKKCPAGLSGPGIFSIEVPSLFQNYSRLC